MTAILTLLFLLVMMAGCAAILTVVFSVFAFIINLTTKDEDEHEIFE